MVRAWKLSGGCVSVQSKQVRCRAPEFFGVSRRMSIHTISEEWRSAFGSALPAGFLCRAALPECWLRIHSLPQSKRYPGSDQEYAEMLGRQNAAGEFVLGNGSECILFITRFGDAQTLSSEDIPLHGQLPTHVMSYSSEDGEDEYQFFALRVIWQPEKFNDLIVACANDQTGPILFANAAAQTIYAPYDGGADLFFSSADDVAAARYRFANWLSSRPDGR
jgi:hypothetical protein